MEEWHMIKKIKKIGIIGCGNMGEAIIKSHQSSVTNYQLIASEKDAKTRDYIKKKYHILLKDNIELIKSSEIIILAVKPQNIKELLNELTHHSLFIIRHPLFISIAAGVSTRFIESFFKEKVRIIRAMPNMPGLIGEGISAVCKGIYATSKDLNKAKRIFSSLGEVIEIEEKYLDVITALSGSGPAYFFYFIQNLVKSGVFLGLREEIVKKLIIQTGLGSLKMLAQGGDAKELRRKVTSNGGTTEAAFKVFTEKKIEEIYLQAIRAAAKRAKELEQ